MYRAERKVGESDDRIQSKKSASGNPVGVYYHEIQIGIKSRPKWHETGMVKTSTQI